MEQTLHSPSYGSQKPPHKEKKKKKYIFDILFGPFKKGIFLLILRFYRGYVKTFISSKMEQTLHSPSYGSLEPPYF